MSKKNQLTHNEDTLNAAIALYLGGSPDSPGYQPTLAHSDRLKKIYPSSWESIESDVLLIIRSLDDPEIKRKNNEPYDVELENHLKNKFYWLEPIIIQKIINYYSYQNR